jgi:hypothetical protein
VFTNGPNFEEEGRRESMSPQAHCCPLLNGILVTLVLLYLFYSQLYRIQFERFVTGNIKILVHALHDELQIKGISKYLKGIFTPATPIITDID